MEYAAGAGYNEQRAYGGLRFGRLNLGVNLVVGQSEVNYFRIGASLALAFDRDKIF